MDAIVDALPLTAKEAKSIGAGYFFTGKICCRGHISKRYVSGSCFECKIEDRAANREKNIEYFKNWRLLNVEKQNGYHLKKKELGYHKDYYAKNREKNIKRATEWRNKNPERSAANQKKWNQENKTYVNQRAKKYKAHQLLLQRKYRKENPDKFRAKTREWRKKYPYRARITDANKKAMRKGAEGRYTKDDVNQILKMQRNKCAYCQKDLDDGYHVDHITPLCRGGSNWPRNLQMLCEPCNLSKHASDPIDFARRIGKLI